MLKCVAPPQGGEPGGNVLVGGGGGGGAGGGTDGEGGGGTRSLAGGLQSGSLAGDARLAAERRMDPGAAEVVCEGWLRKSPPEKKLRRYVDSGLWFTKKELEKSFVFDLKTEARTWYLVAASEDDMNRWVASVCLLCGFKPTQEAPESPPVATVTASAPPPYAHLGLRPLEADGGHAQEDYLWLTQCQTRVRPHEGSSPSRESDNGDHLLPPPSSAASSPSTLGISLPPPSSSSRKAPWAAIPLTGTLSRSLDFSVTPYLHRGGGKPRCHPSPHPRKHSLDFHLRPVAIPLCDAAPRGGYPAPRSPPVTQPLRHSSTPSVAPLSQAELCASTPTPPPRPPKPVAVAAQGESPTGGNSRGRSLSGNDSLSAARSPSDPASAFDFSDSFNSYFFNKGMVPLGSVCAEDDDDVDQNYVAMSAAATEPPLATRPSEASGHRQETNYVPMTPVPASLPASADPPSFGRRVPPPAHTGFRNAPPTAVPPPVHRDLKPPRSGKPAPLHLPPVQREWQEVPPPVRSPVTRTFTRDPSSRHSARPTSSHSSSPSSDSDEPGDSYVAMTTASLSFSAGEPSLRLMRHRTSEGGASAPSVHPATSNKQVEYLDLDLHTGRSTPTRQKRCPDDDGRGDEPADAVGECARGPRVGVDYVVVDPKRTKALRNTREAWHGGRLSTEKCTAEHS
ncbi:GRB2-associated-binding protein 1-like isoform X2 [Phyllopteryx taeniolatus]|uniref:GRB2-associated-binding protein 1-like isoform X2 n=1 Tax=Phyllopteryx taeniolatus TaxID=161469 RepID=UPI002AD47271|nr:GRB2-associated-binding protein 1-like isoform X2 [Phyllopteryx taeniolatus]